MITGYLCVILGCLIVVLILKIQELQKRQVEPEVLYIDRCGITKNPPENFMEIWQGRTLNIRIDNDHVIFIPHIPAMQALKWIEAIANEYAVIAGCMELKSEGGNRGGNL
jgi:hypothetical protein